MEIQTERLTLRRWRAEDAAHLFAIASDPAVAYAAGWKPLESVEACRERITRVLFAVGNFAICKRGEDIPIGSIGLFVAERSVHQLPENEGEIGFWLGSAYWGQGYATEACRAILTLGFEQWYLRAIWCGFFEGNTRSLRVQQKCGFVYHHTEQDVYWRWTDTTHNVTMNRITAAEYRNFSKTFL